MNNTAKHFVLQLGSLISLYLSLAFFLVLAFGFINLRFADSLDNVWQLDSAASSIRFGFAMVVVFFPTYLALTRIVNKNRREDKEEGYLAFTKLLIYLSLLVGGFVLLGDLVAVIMGFLEGELTTRFILKALAVFVVTGAAFYYYVQDAKGYWLTRARASVIYGLTAAVLIGVTCVAAVAYIPSPSEVRERKEDAQTIMHLQQIVWDIQTYYDIEGFPENLTQVYSQTAISLIPPAQYETYIFERTGEASYKLCANFNSTSVSGNETQYLYKDPYNEQNWEHKSGEWCFGRTVYEKGLNTNRL